MAKGKGSIQGWITKNGVHIPIYGEYTVRGGVEPKAKGAKFKRKKRPEEFDKDIRESGGKYWAAHSSAQGKKQGVKDLDKPFDTKEEARAFLAKENGEYEDAKFQKKERNVLGQEVDFAEVDRTAKEREKDFIINTKIPDNPKSIAKAEKQRIAREVADENDAYDKVHGEGKYANRDWNKDVDDAKRYGYSEQSEEGKKPVTKDEEYKSKLAEANKAFDAGDYKEYNRRAKELKQMQASGEVPEDTITGKTQAQRERDDAKFQARQKANEANSLVNEGMDKEEARKVVGEQESSKAFRDKKAQEQGFADDASMRSYNEETGVNKETWKGQESSTSDYIKSSNMDGQELKIPRKTYEDRLATLKKTKEEMLKKPGQNPNTLNKYDQMIKQTEESLRTGVDVENPPKSTKESSTSERKRYKSPGLTQAFKSAKEMTGRSDLEIHQLAQDGLEDHYSFRDKDGNEIGRFSNPHTSKAGYMTLNTSATGDRSKPISKQDSLSAGTNERSRIRGELHAKDKAMKAAMPTTVSGLRSAYADATGSMKSKIAAELRRKGYSLVGGRWVKGK